MLLFCRCNTTGTTATRELCMVGAWYRNEYNDDPVNEGLLTLNRKRLLRNVPECTYGTFCSDWDHLHARTVQCESIPTRGWAIS